ncbi:MAG: SAM-dependent methyltransferase, partial [Nitrosomonas sp.]|nr:SAM-dependent methyltransferase [Nitrosomonas sp.]
MSSYASLPAPSENALQHSHAVQQAIRSKILDAGNWISFAEYMELVLYAPGLGYYSSGTSKFGDSGDFVTAPEISALFGQTLARQAEQILNLLERADILEFGAGSGKLALDILLELEKQKCLPNQYFILELSADL